MNDDTVPVYADQSRDAHDWLPLDTARGAFQVLVTGPKPLSVNGRRFAGLPRRAVPLDELRDRLLSKQVPDRTRDEVWTYLVGRSRRDGAAWTVGCVGMALPALATSAKWLGARYRGDRADVHAAVLTGFLETLAVIDLADPGIVVRLAWAARRAGQVALEESLDAPPPVGSGFRSAAPQPPWGHPDLVLARAVGDGILTATEADLISATRLGAVSMTDWAQSHDAAVKTAFKARDRAEDRLAPWLHGQMAGADSDDPVADAALTAVTATAPGRCDEESDSSLAVSGRHRNGRSADSKKVSRSVSKNEPKSRLLECGETTPTSGSAAASQPISEERRCA